MIATEILLTDLNTFLIIFLEEISFQSKRFSQGDPKVHSHKLFAWDL